MVKKNLLTLDLQKFAEEVVEESGANEVEESATPQEEETKDEASETVEENGNDEPHEQTPEERAIYANARRRAEAEVQKKEAIRNQRIAALCAGTANPTTGNPITNLDEYLDVLEAQIRQQKEAELQEKGVDPQIIKDLVRTDPTVMQANMVMAQMQEQAQLAQVQRDVEEISKLDPNIKGAEDLYNAPYTPALIEFCQKHGTTLTEAFKIINYDSHLAGRDEATRQQAINQMKGKSHLASQPTNVAADNDDDVEVPAEIMSRMKEDGKSEKDIRALFKKTIKNGLSF